MNNKTKKSRRIISIMLTAMLMLSLMSVGVFAAESVTYNGKDKGFSLGSGGSSASDLFPNFKGLMPGDKLSEEITIKNSSDKTVKISMGSLAAGSNAEFLSQLKFKINGDESLGKINNTGGGTELWTALGDFAPGQEKTIKVDIEMPITVGNEYQDAIGTVNWQFKAEEPDDENKDKKDDPNDGDDGDDDGSDSEDSSKKGGAKTGDYTNIWIWIALITSSLGATYVIRSSSRRG